MDADCILWSVDPAWHRLLVAELARPLAQMADNLRYIARELPRLAVADPLRQRVAAMCATFASVLEEEQARIVEAAATDVGPVGGAASGKLGPLAARIDEQVRAYDAVVRDLTRLGAPPLLEILLTESGVNVLAARKDLVRRLDALASDPPEVTDERHVLPCSVCGAVAVTFDLNLERGTGRRVARMRGISRGEELAWREDLLGWIRGGDAAALHRALPEGLDAYCPACARIYCREHYRLEETFDEGFYDCTYATCPAGHRRMIDD